MQWRPQCLVLSLALLWAVIGAAQADDATDFFEKRIRPVLVQHCYECHSAESDPVQAGLRLDTRSAFRAGGDSGAAVVPGNAEASLVLEALRYESYEMPPSGRLPDQVIRDFEHWVSIGAPDPRDDDSNDHDASTQVEASDPHDFWAFQPPARHAPPDVRHDHWPRNDIDRFVLGRVEQAGFSPSGQAEKRTLIRRIYFAIIGLPPTAEQVAAFVADESSGAYDDLVAELLNSPHFGEHWARLWLDVARYAEDQAHIVGNNKELFYPNAHLYRDWVIQAFNDDLPYDEFIRLQLAADIIAEGDNSHLPALGFLGLGPKYYRRGALEVMADEWEDRVDVVTRGLLALTVACARCHDHKFDPIPTEDYYALAGVFASTEMFNRPISDEHETKKDGAAKDPAQAMHVVREGKPTDLNVFIRGDVENKGEATPRRFLSILAKDSAIALSDGSGRRQLAEAIVDPENPLTARVFVNRVWGAMIGHPLVGTPSNFGRLGERPTHPELLDDLAVRFMESGWSLKWLVREIALSATFRQSSQASDDIMEKDPANQWLARMNRRRLSVEQWRDAILAVTGRLDGAIGGESITPDDCDCRRRTVYSTVSRFKLNPMLASFDFPDPNVHAGSRSETTTPLQKLFVLNSDFITSAANELTAQESADSVSNSVVGLYRKLFGRAPEVAELNLACEFLTENGSDTEERWRSLAHALLATNEMLYVD